MGTTWRRSSGSRDLFAGRAREAEGSVGRACADWTRAGQDRQTPLDVLCKPDEQGKQAQQKGGEQGGGRRTHGDARRVQLSPNHHLPPTETLSTMPVPDPSPLPSYFLGHAGVGLVFDPSAEGVRENVRQLGREIAAVEPRPRAILVVSGHFTANEIHGPGVVEGAFSSRALTCEAGREGSGLTPGRATRDAQSTSSGRRTSSTILSATSTTRTRSCTSTTGRTWTRPSSGRRCLRT